jgi:hypothetical protein
MTRPHITVAHGSPEWDALYDALDQYTDNQRDYLENNCQPGEDERGEQSLKFARKILDQMSAVYAALAEGTS